MEKDKQFLTTYEETENWLKAMGIKNYSINENLIIDVTGDVNLDEKKLQYIPVQFGKVGGLFRINNNNLTTLKGCPNVVGGSFMCNNNQLTTLKNCPDKVERSFFCDYNQLTSLEHAPKNISGDFSCVHNKINTLKNFSSNIEGTLLFHNNPIENFDYLEFYVKDQIYLTPSQKMDYLDKYKDEDGDIFIEFEEFKKIIDLKELNKKLNDELFIKTVKIKHKI